MGYLRHHCPLYYLVDNKCGSEINLVLVASFHPISYTLSLAVYPGMSKNEDELGFVSGISGEMRVDVCRDIYVCFCVKCHDLLSIFNRAIIMCDAVYQS